MRCRNDMADESWIEKLGAWYWRRQDAQFYRESISDLVFLLVGILGLYIAGPIYLGWFIWKQAELEKSFHDRYGQNWQEAYQAYYGSLAQAHLKIAICVVALVSIMAIGLWFYRQTRRGKSSRSRR